jgi:hypothetical protein
MNSPIRTSLTTIIRSGNVDSILTNLFGTLLLNIPIDTDRFLNLINRYINNANLPRDNKAISSVTGNIQKELLSTSMSWKSFLIYLLQR